MAYITTVIPAYNAERFIRQTLDSVAAQKRRPDRLIILDNCSTDSTRAIVEAFQKEYSGRCEWVQNERNIGGLPNFNRALEFAAETELLHLLSADDLIKPAFLERVATPLENVSGPAMSYCWIQQIDDRGVPIPPLRKPKVARPVEVSLERFLTNQSELRHVYVQAVLLKTDRRPMAIKFRTDWRQAGDVVFYSEWATWCRKIIELPEPLCEFRVHPQSFTSGNTLNLDAWVMEEWRAMEFSAKVRPLPGEWLRRQRRKVIFGGRSIDKMRMVRGSHPEYAAQIRDAVVKTIGYPHWWLAHWAILARDVLRRREDRRHGMRQK